MLHGESIGFSPLLDDFFNYSTVWLRVYFKHIDLFRCTSLFPLLFTCHHPFLFLFVLYIDQLANEKLLPLGVTF